MNAKHLEVEARSSIDAQKIVKDFLSNFEFSYPVKIKITPKGATQDYKALIGIWSRETAKQFTDRSKTGQVFTPKKMRKLWYHMFIGYQQAEVIGRTRIGEVLGNITDFGSDRGKCYDFARKVEEWCQNNGVQLSQPESDYQRDKERQVA